MLSQDVFVELLRFVELAHGLVQTRQVVGGGDRDGVVVMLVVLSLGLGPLQRRKEVFLWRRRCSGSLNTPLYSKTKPCPQLVMKPYLGLSQVPQPEVQGAQVVEDLGRDVGLHLLLQDARGRAVRRQRSLDVSLLQDLSQLDPGLHVVRVLLRHLLQVTLSRQRDTIQHITLRGHLRCGLSLKHVTKYCEQDTYFGNVSLLLVIRGCIEGAQNLHGLVVIGVGLQNLFETLRCVLLVPSIDIHLSQAEEGQHEGG